MINKQIPKMLNPNLIYRKFEIMISRKCTLLFENLVSISLKS